MFGRADQIVRSSGDAVPLRSRGGLAAIVLGALFIFAAGAATALLLGPMDWSARRVGIGPDAFSDDIGIYLLNDGKYNLLVWKKKIVAGPGTAPGPKNIPEAAREAIVVGAGVRFFLTGSTLRRGP